MKCKYCQQIIFQDKDWAECFTCQTCQVSYINGDQGLHIKWERKLNNFSYALNLYVDRNITILWGFDESKSLNFTMSDVIQIEIPYLITNVNPDTIVNKIKTLLVYS